MKTSKLISITFLLLVFLLPTVITNAQPLDSVENITGPNRFAADETLLLQLYVDKGSYNTGEDIQFSGLLSMNSYPIVGAQVCVNLHFGSGLPDWGACMMTDADGWIYETLVYGDIIPTGYSGTLVLTATGEYDGLTTTSETHIPYGTGWEPPDDDEGDLTIAIYPLDKPEFALGDSPTIAIDVKVDGVGLPFADICADVKLDDGTRIVAPCESADADGHYSIYLEYETTIPQGYYGTLTVWANTMYNDVVVDQTIYVPYGSETPDLPLDLQLWGPSGPIQIGGWEVLQIGGTVTSYGNLVDGATVTMVVAGGTYQTTTGMAEMGKFYHGWENDAFPAGEYVVQVTVSKPGYLSVSGTVPFTLFGENYDFAVVMDPIQAVYDPAINVPFTGTLTLGGAPVSDWIETDVTYPDGSIETFFNQTEADGRFIRILPSIMEPGNYQFAVYYSGDRKQISPVYTFSVGTTITPTVTPSPPKPPSSFVCEIVDVLYPSLITAGDTIQVTGKVVCVKGEETIPQGGWDVKIVGRGNNQSPTNAPQVKTGNDGSFSTSLTLNNFYYVEIFITASDPEEEFLRPTFWFGPLNVVLGLEPDLQLSYTQYDVGELVEGKLILNASSYDDGWDDGLKIIYQIIGPIGGAEQLYLFESQGIIPYTDYDKFYWQIPPNAEFGDYKITAFISGSHFPIQNIESEFYINDIRHTNLTAFVEPGMDEWSSAYLVGEFTDFFDTPIPDAEVRVVFQENSPPLRDFNLTGKTDQDGIFEIDLEPLDLFAGKGQADPWLNRDWLTTVYADKEGYATGAVITGVSTPTISPYLEIISVDPPLDYLSQKTSGIMGYTQLLDMDINITVRYNNIYEGGKLNLLSYGNWTISCPGVDCNDPARKAHLAINGEDVPEWNEHLNKFKHLRSWTYPGYIRPAAYYPYPSLDTEMDAKPGFGQESEITVSGQLFGYKLPWIGSESNPNIPPPWLQLGDSGAIVEISLGKSRAGIHYRLSPPTLSVSGKAWVSPNDGELSAEIQIGQATRLALSKEDVQLIIIAKDVTSGAETPSDEITVPASAKTDKDGKIKLPLTAKTNPCELEKKATYFVKVTHSSIQGEQKIPIDLRCIEDLRFNIDEDAISLVQAVDLSDHPLQLAAGKEAGVRVYFGVEGEIYQPVNKPVTFNVKFEIMQAGVSKQPITQLKKVSLTEEGALVAWADPKKKAANDAGIGFVTKWEEKPTSVEGTDLTYIDFVFIPRQVSGKNGKFQIRITLDPEGVYGDKIEREIQGTVYNMKTLRLIIVPVDIYDIDWGFVFQQTAFLHETYPLGLSNLILDPRDIYETKDIPTTCTSRTLWKEIACGVGREYGVSVNANDPVKVIAIVDSATWLKVNKAYLYAGGISALGTYDDELWDSATNNVVLIRYPENVPNTSAHEIGHAYGLEPKEQYKTHPDHGIPVHGLVLRDSQIYDIPADYRIPAGSGIVKNPVVNTGWARESFNGAVGIYDLMGNAGYYLHNNGEDLVFETRSQQSWVVYKTYNSLFDALKDPSDEDVFFVQGVIGLDGLVQIDPLVKTLGIPNEPTTEGDYELQLLDSSGSVLYNTRFGYTTKPGLFNLQLPYTPGIGRLVVLQGGSVVGELIRSANPPEISMLPLPESNIEDTALDISWTGSDPDGDTLAYSLQYNCDGSEIWIPLASNLSEQSYSVNLAYIPGGACTFKVTASDGVNSTSAISDPFEAPPKGPLVQIMTEPITYSTGDAVLLKARAYDLADGGIPNENMHWISDLDGELGYGSALSVMLSEGTHNLTLFAQDTAGNVSLAEMTLEIEPSTTIEDGDGDNVVDGEGGDDENNNRTLIIVGLVALVVIMLGGAGGLLWFALRKRSTPGPVQPQHVVRSQPGSGQQNMTQDAQGRWWYQDPRTGAWSIWNGNAWIRSSQVPPPAAPPHVRKAPVPVPRAPKARGGSSCLFTVMITVILGVLVVGGITLVAFDILPVGEIQPGEGELSAILKTGGGGLLVTVLGGFLVNGGLKAIITRQAVVEDEWGRRKEKRGCSAVLNGLGSLLFGLLCLIGGLSLMTLAVFQEVLPWLGF